MDVGVTFRAARGRYEIFAREKSAVECIGVRRREGFIRSESKIIRFGDPFVVLLRREFGALDNERTANCSS